MFGQELDHRLSPEDFAFLLMDNEREPMNIGSIAIFEGEVPYREYVANIESKLHLIPRYTQIVVPAPFNVGRPTWEADPHFDVHRHIHEEWIEAPGSLDQLLEFAAEVQSRPLDRGMPLWQLYLVQGLEGGNSAIVSSIHHCMVDGVGGVELAMVMLDTTPDPPRVTYSQPVERKPVPSRPRLLIDALFDDVAETFDRWALWQRRFTDLLAQEGGWAQAIGRGLEAALPYFALPVKRASFNQKLSATRKMAVSDFSLAAFREMRKATGATINDLALAITGAAVGRYMREGDEPTKKRMLRILTPVNVRSEVQSGRMGNRISMLLVEVPLWECDPLERLQGIKQRTSWLKAKHAGDGIEMIGEELLALPTPLLKAVTAFGSPPNTVANMVCTNVPGPVMPLYTVGHRMLAHYPVAPLGWEMGLSCALTSYDGAVTFSLIADGEAVEDVGRLKKLVDEAYLEMLEATGVAMPAEADVTVTAVAVGA